VRFSILQDTRFLRIVMKEGWNGLDLGKALVAEQKKISAGLPAGISFSKVTDQAVNIREAVDEFMLKFFVALAVVMIVSILSLGWRVAIVVAAAVPLTLAAVFVIMLLTGRVFDRITLGALILGLGLLVAGREKFQRCVPHWKHAEEQLRAALGETTMGELGTARAEVTRVSA
jgi:multidrug efflux pump subunit AcrB